jgi:hypothetical protein
VLDGWVTAALAALAAALAAAYLARWLSLRKPAPAEELSVAESMEA